MDRVHRIGFNGRDGEFDFIEFEFIGGALLLGEHEVGHDLRY